MVHDLAHSHTVVGAGCKEQQVIHEPRKNHNVQTLERASITRVYMFECPQTHTLDAAYLCTHVRVESLGIAIEDHVDTSPSRCRNQGTLTSQINAHYRRHGYLWMSCARTTRERERVCVWEWESESTVQRGSAKCENPCAQALALDICIVILLMYCSCQSKPGPLARSIQR
jgi:hypothetical protein